VILLKNDEVIDFLFSRITRKPHARPNFSNLLYMLHAYGRVSVLLLWRRIRYVTYIAYFRFCGWRVMFSHNGPIRRIMSIPYRA